MTDDKQAQLQADRDALRFGVEQQFWRIIDRELAKQEQAALDMLLSLAEPSVLFRKQGELAALRKLRSMPRELINGYEAILKQSVAR